MRKAMVFMVLLLGLMPLLSGCSLWEQDVTEPPPEDRPSQEDFQSRETVFYFPDASGRIVVPVCFGIPWQEGIARATLSYAMEGKVPQEISALGLSPLLPAGTEILGLTVSDGLARVDFNNAFLNYDISNERSYIYGLVFTLTEFPTINRVEILIDGNNPVVLPGGTVALEPFDREKGLNLEVADAAGESEQTERVVLYYLYQTAQDAFFVPVTRVVGKVDNVVEQVIEELLDGPAPGSPLFSAIPRNVSLDSVNVQGNKVTVRLAGSLSPAGGGQLSADQIRDQLALTLTEIPGIMEIEVLVSGHAPQFGAGISFPSSFGRPKKWNYVSSGGHVDSLN